MTIWNDLFAFSKWVTNGESNDTSINITRISFTDGQNLTPLKATPITFFGDTYSLPLSEEMEVVIKDVKTNKTVWRSGTITNTHPTSSYAFFETPYPGLKSTKFKTEYAIITSFKSWREGRDYAEVDKLYFTVYDYAWEEEKETALKDSVDDIFNIGNSIINIIESRVGVTEAARIIASPTWLTVAAYFPMWSEKLSEAYLLQKEWTERGEQAIYDKLNRLKDEVANSLFEVLRKAGEDATDFSEKITLGVITDAVKKVVLPYTKHIIVGGLIVAGIIAGIIILPRLVTSLSHGVVKAVLSRDR